MALGRAISNVGLICGVCAVLIFCPRNACAQTVRVDLEPVQTRILFTLGATLHTVHGTFRMQSGSVQFDLSTGKVADGEIVIDATSGNTANSGRDSKMNKSVLESDKYSDIVFVPRQIHGQVAIEGESQVQIEGVMRLHGSEHAISVPVTTRIDNGELTAKAEMTIPYVEWGLKDPSTFVLRVDKNVKIEVETQGQVEVAH
jgi:polyisoprenoid-binding protein YceI